MNRGISALGSHLRNLNTSEKILISHSENTNQSISIFIISSQRVNRNTHQNNQIPSFFLTKLEKPLIVYSAIQTHTPHNFPQTLPLNKTAVVEINEILWVLIIYFEDDFLPLCTYINRSFCLCLN